MNKNLYNKIINNIHIRSYVHVRIFMWMKKSRAIIYSWDNSSNKIMEANTTSKKSNKKKKTN